MSIRSSSIRFSGNRRTQTLHPQKCRKYTITHNQLFIIFIGEFVCSLLIRIPFIFDPLFVNSHSERNVFTGLIIAALIEWKLTVTSVIKMIDPPAILKGIIPAETLNAKPSSHRSIIKNAMGNAINRAIIVNLRKLLHNINATLAVDAPTTFRMLISFCLFCAEKADKPKRPRHEMTTAITAKHFDKDAIFCSDEYNC